jgi:hypothetical protein
MQDTIVLLPAPGMGHIISMVELGKLILHHYAHKFSITILFTTGSDLDTPSITSYIHRVSQSNPSISFHQLPSVSVDTAPTRTVLATAFEFIRLSIAHVPHTLQQISNSSTIRALIIDFFCTATLPIAKDLNLPVYYFFTSGAYCLAAMLYLPKIHDQTTESFKDLTATELHFPGMSSPLKATHMPEPTLDRDDPGYWDMLYFCSHLPKSNGIIANTFDDLESKALKAIADGVCVPNSPTPPVYCIGPLIADAEERASEDESECYITLNELQIVDQQISLTQCISHTLEKLHTLCFAHSLRKILQLYFSCSLEGTLSLSSLALFFSFSEKSSHISYFSLIRSSQFIGIGEAPIHDEK